MDLEDRRMSDPRMIEVPWQQQEPPDGEWFPDDFDEATDAHLEQAYEDRINGGFEDYEPSVYDGTYSEE